VDRVLRGSSVLVRGAWWHDDSASDDAVTAVSNNSPPPDYATCVAADLERFRRHIRLGDRSRRLSSPSADLDINENLQASATSALQAAPKLLPVSFTPAHTAGGLSALHCCKVAPVTGAETADSRTNTSDRQQAETTIDSSTWPRRHSSASLSFAAVDVNDEASTTTSAVCKRLHHPDGASNPQLSVEVSRSDAVDDWCKLRTFLDVDVDSLTALPTAIPSSCPVSTSHHHRHPTDNADATKCRHSCHSAMESGETLSPVQSPRMMADEQVINGSNLPTSGSNENFSTTRHGIDAVPPTLTSPKTVRSTRVKATSCAGKVATPKRSKSSPSSGLSLLWCIHPRCGRSKSACLDVESGADGADAVRLQSTADVGQRLTGDDVVTDSDRGSSLSECPPQQPTALELARRLCSGGDDDDASSDYWSAKASADHLPSTSYPVSSSNARQTSSTSDRGCSTADPSLLTWRRNVGDSDMVGKS